MTSSAVEKPLYGLVLSGGKSQRMGQDKAALVYHGTTQRRHVYGLLATVCDQTYISLRADQEPETDLPSVVDSLHLGGPFNGILSAMQKYPTAAWLVMACDMPLVTPSSLENLINARNLDKVATAYALQGSYLPEPLLAIWEPAAFEPAYAFAQTGKSCPRKFLLQQDIQLVHPAQDQELYNANSPEEFLFAQNHLKAHGK